MWPVAEDSYANDGRHRSQGLGADGHEDKRADDEALGAVEAQVIEPAEPASPLVGNEEPLPGPPPGPLSAAEKWSQSSSAQGQPGEPWSQAFGPSPSAAPPQRSAPAAAPGQRSTSAVPPQRSASAVVPPQRSAPAAPRRSVQPDAGGSPTAHIPAVDKQPASAPAATVRPPRPAGAAADAYRRTSAPTQAAAAGIRHELASKDTEAPSPAAAGMRGAINKMGLKLGPGPKERRRRALHRRIRAPKDSMYSIAVLTLKGGSGKTTTTSTLGQVFASIRSDGVIAVDADPSAGDLPLRTATHPEDKSMIDLLAQEDLNQRDYVIRYLSTTDSDLQVLANGWRADSDQVLEPEDIRDVHLIASHYYSLLLWDADENLHSPLVREVLSKSDALVLLVQASPQGAVAAGNAIDWLRFHGFEGLLERTVLLVNQSTPRTRIDMEWLHGLLQRQQLKIHQIPFDKHLDEGLAVDLCKLQKKTRMAFEELAGMLADDFVTPQAPAAIAASAS